jgi:hypothetical protein
MSDEPERSEVDEPARECPDREIVEATLADVNARIASLQDRKEALKAEIAEIEKQFVEAVGRRLYWTKYLNTKTPQPKNRRPKLPSGEPLRRLNEYYDQNPGKAYSVNELAQVLGMEWVTIYQAMNRQGSGFTRMDSDVWVKTAPAEDASGTKAETGKETPTTTSTEEGER